MNKELIKKYKPEFDHWLNGGDILILIYGTWRKEVFHFGWDKDGVQDMVINDEYVEFRKALAEGKNIKRKGYISIECGQSDTIWVDSNVTDMLNYHPSQLYVELFKVGDWVRQIKDNYSDFPVIHKIRDYISDDLYSVEANISDVDVINNTNKCYELWVPKEGEWCVFWDNDFRHYEVGKYTSLKDGIITLMMG